MPGTLGNLTVMHYYWKTKQFMNLKNEKKMKWKMADYDVSVRLTWIPDLIVGLSAAGEFKIMVKEAGKLHIPLLAIVDSESDPLHVTYPLHSNDDHIVAAFVYVQFFLICIQKGLKLNRLLIKQLMLKNTVPVSEKDKLKYFKNELLFDKRKRTEKYHKKQQKIINDMLAEAEKQKKYERVGPIRHE
jgi:ribosomal protein S2